MRRGAALPVSFHPALAKPAMAAPEGDAWLHEIRLNGRRIGCRIDRGRVSLVDERGREWGGRLAEVAAAARSLAADRALLDGQITMVLESGRTSAEALARALRDGETEGLVYFAFDLVHLDGVDLARRPLEERKERLERLLAGGPAVLRYVEHVVGRGPEMLREACRLGLDGIVSKRRDAAYAGGRRSGWLEVACRPAETAIGSEQSPRAAESRAPPTGRRVDSAVEVAGVRISHPERVFYPDLGLTKLDLARFYVEIADWILPHVVGRPLTVVRCPDGVAGECLYMRHSKVWAPAPLRTVRIREKTKIGEYLVVDSLPALIALVQMDVLEIHTWNTRADDVERPDRIVFDLDPGPEVSWASVIAAARRLRRELARRGLRSFVKTTGGSGLHVVAPILPRNDWSECLRFSRRVAEELARTDPGTFTTSFAKAGRERKILLDYLRNNRTNTSVAAFSTRARPRATVSVTLDWRELVAKHRSENDDVPAVRRRLARLRADPWRDYWATRQRLPQ